jgi:NAD+ diphosphatase
MTPRFTPGIDYIYPTADRSGRAFVYRGDRLLVKASDQGPAPLEADDWVDTLPIAGPQRLALGQIGGEICWAQRLDDDWQPPSDWHFEGLRSLFGRMADAPMAAAGYGLQIVKWVEAQRFCGRCGAPTALGRGVRMLQCTRCEHALFPQVSPAVIVAVISRDRLLLARAGRFAGRMFSVLAGYVEPGETLEECVRREVFEEVGLQIGRIRYFGSQPWPFSGSLMVAFTAVHTGGTIAVDHKEILEAGWFTPQNLPEIPSKMSIARQLIDWFVAHYGTNQI